MANYHDLAAETPFKDPNEPATPDEPNPYPVTDPIIDPHPNPDPNPAPEPIPGPPEPIPGTPPDVIF